MIFNYKKRLKIDEYYPKKDIEVSAINFLKYIKKLTNAYFVGGYVRDFLFNKYCNKKISIKEIDIAIPKTPTQVENIFELLGIDYKILNKDFGVYLVKFENFSFEVACFRIDFINKDGRRPSKVFFTKSMKKDSKRRDFTINSIYLDPFLKTIYDYNNGMKDIKAQNIKFIGNSKKRIKEDYLRILRYVRFKNKYNLNYNEKDYLNIKENCKNLSKISNDRIKKEFDEMLKINNISTMFYELDKLKVLDILIPELKKIQGITYRIENNVNIDVYSHIVDCIKNLSSKNLFNILKKYLDNEFILQTNKDIKEYIIEKFGVNFIWEIIFLNIGKIDSILDSENVSINFKNYSEISLSLSYDIMRRYNFSKKDKEDIVYIINNYQKIKELRDYDSIKIKKFSKNNNFLNLIILYLVQFLAENEGKDELYINNNIEYFEYLVELFNNSFSIKEKLKEILDANLLKEFNIENGPIFGKILDEIEDLFLEDKIKTRNGVIKFLERKTGKVYLGK